MFFLEYEAIKTAKLKKSGFFRNKVHIIHNLDKYIFLPILVDFCKEANEIGALISIKLKKY